MKAPYSVFRDRLRLARKRLKLTLQALAGLSDVSKSIIFKIEHGQVQPTLETASRIAQGLNLTLSDMLLTEQKNTTVHVPVSQQLIFKNKVHSKKFMSPLKRGSCIEIFNENINANTSINEVNNTDTEKFFLLIEGNLTISSNSVTFSLNNGDCLHLEQAMEYCIKNSGENEANFITITHRK